MNKIIIDWTYPMDMKNILDDERMEDTGIYYITRIFGRKVSDLYIGKTIYSFGSRLSSHSKYWLDNYRGNKQVRLGYIISPKTLSEKIKKELIDDAERTIIWLMRDSLIHNKQCMNNCKPKHRLHITNIGYRGNLPSEMYFSDEE